MQKAIKKVVIAGGGTAGWMTAALLQKVFEKQIQVELVESEAIGIIGVGEATIPPIQTYNKFVGFDEKEMLRETNGSIKLAIRFENWRKQGEQYYHTFGAPGTAIGFNNFNHYWTRAQQELGLNDSIWDYDLNYLACEQGVFNKINTQNKLFEMPYAYHFDATLYGKYLRKIAEQHGAVRTEGKIAEVLTDTKTGFITALGMENGSRIEGDLFIDCTGMRKLLIGDALGVEYEDWSDLLAANRAIAIPTERHEETAPYTRSIAHDIGWQWRIPLTHRNGNGIVYSSSYMSDDQALQRLMTNLDTQPLDDPRFIQFTTGRTKQQWHKNVVAIGLSSGFLEPLESTSIHLIQAAAVRLMKYFPHKGIHQATIDTFNHESKTEYETIRDFIILHYVANERDDSDFWRDMRHLNLPERLQRKIDVFRAAGTLDNDQHDIFLDASWLQVMMGQGIIAEDYHPAAKAMPAEELRQVLQQIYSAKRQPLEKLLKHDAFLNHFVGQ